MDKKKKQIIIVGVLLAVMLAVGAFQVVSLNQPIAVDPAASGPPADAGGAVADAEAGPSTEQLEAEKRMLQAQIQTILAASATPRDPFRQKGDVTTAGADSAPAAPENPRIVGNGGAAAPVEPPVRRPRSPMGDVAVFDPFPQGGGPGVLPLPGGSPLPQGGFKGPGEQSQGIPAEPSYKIAGVIVGNSKMAIVEDSAGNQKLVKEGGSIDGQRTVVGIEPGRVSVQEGGRTKVLPLEDDRR